MSANLTTSEKSDHYACVIAQGERARVIVCKHNLQWVIQRRKGGPQGRWLAVGYCRARSTVLRLWAGLGEPPNPALDALPERMRGGAA